MSEIEYLYDTEINDVQVLATEEISDAEALQYVRKIKEINPSAYKLYVDIWKGGNIAISEDKKNWIVLERFVLKEDKDED